MNTQKILSISEAEERVLTFRQQGNSIILVGGVFDLFHEGHRQFLAHAKEQGDILILLLESDKAVKKRKGDNRPYHTQTQRAQNLSTNPNVDLVILLPSDFHDRDYDELVTSLKPAIIATTKGDPYRHHKERQAQKINAEVKNVIDRLPDYSTTKLFEQL